MSLENGIYVEMTKDIPRFDIHKGDVCVVKKVCNNKEYEIYIEDKNISFYSKPDYFKIYRYQAGDRVEIINPKSKYKGYHCTVVYNESSYDNYISLYVDGTIYHPNEFGGKYLKLVKSSIKLIDKHDNIKGENNMKLTGFNKVAAIEYGSRNFHYALYDDDIEVGDNVLVTGELANKQHLVVKNILTPDEVKEVYSGFITEEVKCKLDLSKYNNRVKNRTEAEKLRKKMDEEIKKMDELNKYEMYADKNPALKEMLEQLKSLCV